jgi:hypothetical protein
MTPFYNGKLFITPQHRNVIEYSYNLCTPILGKKQSRTSTQKNKKNLSDMRCLFQSPCHNIKLAVLCY